MRRLTRGGQLGALRVVLRCKPFLSDLPVVGVRAARPAVND